MAKRVGILMPFRITRGDADIATATGDALRETRIGTILGMRASSAGEVGELPWDPERGSKLDAMRNAALSSAVEDFAVVYTEEALLDALPEEKLRSVAVTVDDRTIVLHTETQLASDASSRAKTLPVTTKIKR